MRESSADGQSTGEAGAQAGAMASGVRTRIAPDIQASSRASSSQSKRSSGVAASVRRSCQRAWPSQVEDSQGSEDDPARGRDLSVIRCPISQPLNLLELCDVVAILTSPSN